MCRLRNIAMRDYQESVTDRRTNRQTPDKVIPMCRYALQATQKGWPRVGAWTGTLKNHTKCLWRCELDRRSNFLHQSIAHLCAVTCMTEISLIVTLNNQFTVLIP